MHRRRFLSLFAAPALVPVAANAFSVRQIDHPLRAVEPEGGALSWNALAEAVDNRFPDTVRQLDGTEVTLAGFIFPYEAGDRQTRFLLSAYAWHCATCATRDLSQLIDVTATAPLPFTPEQVLIKGRLELLDAPARLYYRLTNARQA